MCEPSKSPYIVDLTDVEQYNVCSNRCDLILDYTSSVFKYEYDSSKCLLINYDINNSNIKYNGENFNLSCDIKIYIPSIHKVGVDSDLSCCYVNCDMSGSDIKYSKTEDDVVGEIIVTHTSLTGNKLHLCKLIKIIDNNETLDTLINNYYETNARYWNLNTLFPPGIPFLEYTSSYYEKNCNFTNIGCSNNDIYIIYKNYYYMSDNVYNEISGNVVGLDISYNYYNMKDYIYYNNKGAKSGDQDDDIFIDCSPVEMTPDMDDNNQNNQNNPSMGNLNKPNMGNFNKELSNFFQKNWPAFVLAIIIIVLFAIVYKIYKSACSDDCDD